MELLDGEERPPTKFKERVDRRLAKKKRRKKQFRGFYAFEVDGAMDAPFGQVLQEADMIHELIQEKTIWGANDTHSVWDASAYTLPGITPRTPATTISRDDSFISTDGDDVNNAFGFAGDNDSATDLKNYVGSANDESDHLGEMRNFENNAITDLFSGNKTIRGDEYQKEATGAVANLLSGALNSMPSASTRATPRTSIIQPRRSILMAKGQQQGVSLIPPQMPEIPRTNSGRGAMAFGNLDDSSGSNISLLETQNNEKLAKEMDQQHKIVDALSQHEKRANAMNLHIASPTSDDEDRLDPRLSKQPRDSIDPDHSILQPTDETQKLQRKKHRRERTQGRLKWNDQLEEPLEQKKPKKTSEETRHLVDIEKREKSTKSRIAEIGSRRTPRRPRTGTPRQRSPAPADDTPRQIQTPIVVTPAFGHMDDEIEVLEPLDPSAGGLDPASMFRHKRIQSSMLEIAVDQTDSKRKLRTLLYEAQLARKRQRKTLERLLNRVQAEGFKYVEASRTIVALVDNRADSAELKNKQDARDRDARVYMKNWEDGRYMHNMGRRVPPTMLRNAQNKTEFAAKMSFVQRIKNPSVQASHALPVDMPVRRWNEPNPEYGSRVFRAFHRKAGKAQSLEKRSVKQQAKVEIAQQNRDEIMARINDFRADIAARTDKRDITDDWLLDKRNAELDSVVAPYAEKVQALVKRIENHKKLLFQLNRVTKKTRSAVEQNVPHRMVRLYAWLQDLDKSVEHHLKYKITFKKRTNAYKCAIADALNVFHASCGYDNKTRTIDPSLLQAPMGQGNFVARSRRDVRRPTTSTQSHMTPHDRDLVVWVDERMRGLDLKTRKRIRRQIVRDVLIRHNVFERARRFYWQDFEDHRKASQEEAANKSASKDHGMGMEMDDEEALDSDDDGSVDMSIIAAMGGRASKRQSGRG